jgi:putative ABC transport system permease protein
MPMMNRMVVSNVVHRPVRSLISVIAIALEVTMILLIVGFSLGTLNDSRQRQAGIGADVIVLPPASSAIVGMTGAPAPIKVADILAKLPHVTSVAPVLMQFSIGTGGAPEFIYGIDLKKFESLSGPFTYLQGGPFQAPDDALVDNVFAQSKHIKVGDSVEILNHTFRVVGIVMQGKGARKFLPIATLQEMSGAKDKATAFYVKLDSPSSAEAVVHEVKNVPGMLQYVTRSMSEYLSMMTPDNIPLLSIFIKVVIGIQS